MGKTMLAGILILTAAVGTTTVSPMTSKEAKRPVTVVAGAKALSKTEKATVSGLGTMVKHNGGGTSVNVPGTVKVKVK
jgi:hypothetical protein